MKVVVAPDSFKGSLSAARAGGIVRAALRAARPGLDVVVCPMADGGEGTAEALMAARGGTWIACRVAGPLPDQRVEAGYAWMESAREAVVEMAAASGLTLVPPGEQDPLKTTTYGTGELMAAAFGRGARRLLLAVGGSATVDGGVGAVTALGWQFLDDRGKPVGPGGGELERIRTIHPPAAWLPPPVDVLCDVTNPLLGPEGAARVFGPQKGATPGMVEQLEAGLANLARRGREQVGVEISTRPGGGAAGGLAAGAAAFLGARLVSGTRAVIEATGLAEALAGADWVITGEGRLDETSLRGKVVSGVIEVARRAGARVAVLAGRVGLSPEACRGARIERVESCAPAEMLTPEALARAEELLRTAAGRLAGQLD
ncbi:MAG: glycerate kinase [Kiritimatiellae bacterium]|nr:glycerate kinase [Kiritimatiellia bacterium]